MAASTASRVWTITGDVTRALAFKTGPSFRIATGMERRRGMDSHAVPRVMVHSLAVIALDGLARERPRLGAANAPLECAGIEAVNDLTTRATDVAELSTCIAFDSCKTSAARHRSIRMVAVGTVCNQVADAATCETVSAVGRTWVRTCS